MRREEAVKAFRKAFEQLAHSRNYATVFEDFLDFALWQFEFKKTQERYDEIKHLDLNYKKEEVPIMAQLFQAWTYIADNDGEGFHDAFGDLFMELVSHGHNGQFFTPEPLAEMMAQLVLAKDLQPGQTVYDCACGSGRMLLAAGKMQRKAKFYGADISVTCCKMAVLNLLVNTMEGEIAHMDTISLDHFKSWHIHKFMDANGCYLPYYTVSGAGQSRMLPSIRKMVEEHEKQESEIPSFTFVDNDTAIFNKPTQLNLF